MGTLLSEHTSLLLAFLLSSALIFSRISMILCFSFPKVKKKKHNKVLLHKPYLYFSGNFEVKLFYHSEKSSNSTAFGERRSHLEFTLELSQKLLLLMGNMCCGSLKFQNCMCTKFELSFCVLKLLRIRGLGCQVLKIPERELSWNKMIYLLHNLFPAMARF